MRCAKLITWLCMIRVGEIVGKLQRAELDLTAIGLDPQLFALGNS